MRHLSSVLVAVICGSAALASAKTLTVSPDGSANFKTVQDAIAAVPDNSTERTLIHINPGTYQGPFVIPKSKTNITLQGDGADKTILTWDRNVNDPRPEGADKFNPGLHVQGDGFEAADLTIQDTSGDHGQALAVRADGDRAIFSHCHILGWQDTLMVNNGRDYFQDCAIAGRVDFIYGSATAWFESCEIHSRNGGHVTAASTPQDHPFGFVFDHCHLTGDATPWSPPPGDPVPAKYNSKSTPIADLGRPWRPYASVTFMNCIMDGHISPVGWNNWKKPENEKTARFSEYHNTGPGAASDERVSWAKQLTAEQASAITIGTVLGGDDHWNPAVQIPATQPAAAPTAQ